jgi:hypothetical protein
MFQRPKTDFNARPLRSQVLFSSSEQQLPTSPGLSPGCPARDLGQINAVKSAYGVKLSGVPFWYTAAETAEQSK